MRSGYGIFYNGLEEIGGSPDLGENFPFDFNEIFTNPNPVTPIIPNNSIGLLETSFSNISLDPKNVSIAGVNLRGQQYKMQNPYSENYNFTLEYQFSASTIASLGYVGSQSRHIPANHGDNHVSQILPPGTNVVNYVPLPDFARDAIYTAWESNANYNSMQLKVERRFSAGLNLLGAYTWSKGRSDAQDPLENGGIAGYRALDLSGFGIHSDYGLTSFDVRNALHFSGGYQLLVKQINIFRRPQRSVGKNRTVCQQTPLFPVRGGSENVSQVWNSGSTGHLRNLQLVRNSVKHAFQNHQRTGGALALRTITD